MPHVAEVTPDWTRVFFYCEVTDRHYIGWVETLDVDPDSTVHIHHLEGALVGLEKRKSLHVLSDDDYKRVALIDAGIRKMQANRTQVLWDIVKENR